MVRTVSGQRRTAALHSDAVALLTSSGDRSRLSTASRSRRDRKASSSSLSSGVDRGFGRSLHGALLAVVAVLSAGVASCVSERNASPASDAPQSCPVTLPNGDTPPSQPSSPQHHGNGALWTVLWPYGTIIAGPKDVKPDGSIGMKFPWWRSVDGRLTIEGRRLDRAAPPVTADIPEGYGDRGLQASGIVFPTEGCWEVTGRAAGARLTFVVMVVKPPPNSEAG